MAVTATTYIPTAGKTFAECSMQELSKLEPLNVPEEATQEMIDTASKVCHAMYPLFSNLSLFNYTVDLGCGEILVRGAIPGLVDRYVSNKKFNRRCSEAEVDACKNLALYTKVPRDVIEAHARFSGYRICWNPEDPKYIDGFEGI